MRVWVMKVWEYKTKEYGGMRVWVMKVWEYCIEYKIVRV